MRREKIKKLDMPITTQIVRKLFLKRVGWIFKKNYTPDRKGRSFLFSLGLLNRRIIEQCCNFVRNFFLSF